MNIKRKTEIIAGYYSCLQDFHRSGEYSRSDQSVYIASDKAHWLVVDWKRIGTVQARLTDANGLVMAWDTYFTNQTDIRLVEAVRRSEHGKEFVTFVSEEIEMIHQFADGSREGTCAMLRAIIPQIKDGQTRRIVEQTADKVERLSESDCGELIAVTRKRCEIEREREIRTRGNEARKQAQEC